MLESFLEIFYQSCESLVPLIVPVFAIYLIIKITSDLLFR